MTNNVTSRRKVLLEALQSGPKSWSFLRRTYYVGERALSKASTSFHNQLVRMQSKGLITKADGEYKITDAGKIAIHSTCNHVLDSYGRCYYCMQLV